MQAVVLTGASNAVKSCVAGSLATAPTCGWATTATGAHVANSQGFCCSCSLSQVAKTTVGSTVTTGKADLLVAVMRNANGRELGCSARCC